MNSDRHDPSISMALGPRHGQSWAERSVLLPGLMVTSRHKLLLLAISQSISLLCLVSVLMSIACFSTGPHGNNMLNMLKHEAVLSSPYPAPHLTGESLFPITDHEISDPWWLCCGRAGPSSQRRGTPTPALGKAVSSFTWCGCSQQHSITCTYTGLWVGTP